MTDGVKPGYTEGSLGESRVVTGIVFLMTRDGTFGAYMAQLNPEYPMPSRETLDEITRLLATEWAEPNKEGSPDGE